LFPFDLFAGARFRPKQEQLTSFLIQRAYSYQLRIMSKHGRF
jgi:hypothetical protein